MCENVVRIISIVAKLSLTVAVRELDQSKLPGEDMGEIVAFMMGALVACATRGEGDASVQRKEITAIVATMHDSSFKVHLAVKAYMDLLATLPGDNPSSGRCEEFFAAHEEAAGDDPF